MTMVFASLPVHRPVDVARFTDYVQQLARFNKLDCQPRIYANSPRYSDDCWQGIAVALGKPRDRDATPVLFLGDPFSIEGNSLTDGKSDGPRWEFKCRAPAIGVYFGRFPTKTVEGTTMNGMQQGIELTAILPGPDGGFVPCPTVMTEEELIRFLRIPEISGATNQRHVVENLKRMHGLPRIHLCGKAVYLTDSVRQWLQRRVTCGQ